MNTLEIDQTALARVCQQLGVLRLDIFGSAAARQLTPESDIDVLVEFDPLQGKLFERYFSLKEQLEALWERPVDIVMINAIKNPFFQDSIMKNRIHVYSAESEKTPV